MRLTLAVGAALLLSRCDEHVEPSCPVAGEPASDVGGFHGDGVKLGSQRDKSLFAARVGASMGKRWASAPFAPATVAGRTFAGRAYASPLFAADVATPSGRHDVVVAATTAGEVVAVSAFGGPATSSCLPAGAPLWRRVVAAPAVAPNLDGGIALGVLSTPVLDRSTSPARLYVTALDATGWALHALDLATGSPVSGFPVRLGAEALEPLNTNGPAKWQAPEELSQRGALAFDAVRHRLYVAFGSFRFASVGWIAAVDTQTARVVASFSSAPTDVATSNGGIWGAGGPAVDAVGDVWVATGNSPPESQSTPRVYGNSLLRLSPDLQIRASYTPFNYCKLDAHNIDLAGSAPLLLPPMGSERTTTPHLVACGGKQGNVYLVDRDQMAESSARPPCSADAATDASLHPPAPAPQFGKPGPLNVFGPYSDELGEVDHAKMRSRPAYTTSPSGDPWLFVSGTSKESATSTRNVAPGLARLRVVLEPGRAAHLAIDGTSDVVLQNPGSPVVTETGDDRIVWLLDENAPRSRPLLDDAEPRPVLYAIDGRSMSVLFRSADGALVGGGKYQTPVVARGTVFVATDRIHAFSPEAP